MTDLESSPRPSGRRKWLRIVGTAASMILLIWMLSQQDWEALRAFAAGIPPLSFLAALACLFASQGWNTLRWWILMRVQLIRVGYALAFRLTSSGLFASNFLPGTIGGDVIRIAGVIPQSPNTAVGVASVVVDRGIGVTTMVLVLPLSLATFGGLLAPAVNGILTSMAVPLSVADRLRQAVRRLGEVLRPWLAQPQSLLGALLASMAGVLAYLLAIWIIARGLAMDVTLVQVAGVTGITYFLSQIPISVNAFGIREAAMIALYTQLGSTAEQAAALALISRALVMLATVPGAFWLPGLLGPRKPHPTEGNT